MRVSRNLLILFAGIITVAIPMAYNACSKGFEVVELASENGTLAPPQPPPTVPLPPEVPPCSGGNCETETLPSSNVSPFNDSLMTADQILRSLGALTQVTLSPGVPGLSSGNERAVLDEFNERLNSFPSEFNPRLVSVAGLISAASLAGEFCELRLTEDIEGPSSQRKLVRVDLILSKSVLAESEFVKSGEDFAKKFWGRPLVDNERLAIREFYNELFFASDTGAKLLPKDMLRALCAGMLASFDSISI